MKKLITLLIIFSTITSFQNKSDNTYSTSLSELSNNGLVWLHREDIKSRNGESSGYAANINPNSNKVFIFLAGGGACFNAETCESNLDSFTEEDFNQRVQPQQRLILNPTNPNSPFFGWNTVYVPYSTGDIHVGNSPSVDVPNSNLSNQMMVGKNNLTIILNEIKEYFDVNNREIEEIAFAGSSAGGFGILPNYIQLKSILGEDVKTTSFIDAAPIILDDSVFSPCLSETWDSVWNVEYPNDMDSVVQNNYDYNQQKYYEYISRKYPEDNFGLMVYYQDPVIRYFYNFGKDNCAYPPVGSLDEELVSDAILGVHTDVLQDLENFKVFFKNGNEHALFSDFELNQNINGTTLLEWMINLKDRKGEDLLEKLTLSVDEQEFNNIVEIYPNPSNGQFNLKYNKSIKGDIELQIYNLKGSLISTKSLQNNGLNLVSLNYKKIPKGTYIIRINHNNNNYTKKLIIK